MCIRVNGDFSCQSNERDAGIDSQLATHRLSYSASVTACLAAAFPGETICVDIYGPSALVISSDDSTAMMPLVAFVRFDFDQRLAGKTVAAVTLEVTTTTTPQAASDHSGSVWQANPFTQQSIDSATPGKTVMLAADRGAVQKATAVDWTLPATLVDATSPLCLELESASTNNAIYDRNATLLIDVD